MPRRRFLNSFSQKMSLENKLIKASGNRWEFATEIALEKFVWENLSNIFGLIPLKRQYSINGERCDIIATSHEGQLVILELKNIQDRGVVQQLTRYYVNVIETKPFHVDYSQPIRLIAVTPNFHRHNFIDREYNHLEIEFIEFIIEDDNGEFYLKLKNVDNDNSWTIKINYQPEQLYKFQDYLPPAPNVLLKIIEPVSVEAQQIILQVREKILCFHERMQEIKGSNCVKYGKGGNKICAEIRPNNLKIPGFVQPILFLYLPIPDKITLRSFNSEAPNSLRKHPLGRMQILSSNTSKNWHTFPSWGVASYIPPGKRKSLNSYSMNSFTPFINKKADSDLDTLIDLALESWLDRL
jgi:RecB family endonuclease NucS